MSDAKGVEKFAEDFIIGTVGFIYSAVTTTAIVMFRPIRGPARFRALKHPDIRPLSGPVAMFLSYLVLVFYFSTVDSHLKSTKDFLALTDLSSVAWYQKLIAIVILYIVSDCLVRLAGRLFTRSRRHYYRDCDRLRYAISGSAIFLLSGMLLLGLPIWFTGYDFAGSAVLLAVCCPSILLVVVLGSIVRARFRERHPITNVLIYILAIPLIWIGAAAAFGASFGAYKALDLALKYEPEVSYSPGPTRRVNVPALLCLIQSDGSLTISAVFENESASVAVFAPGEISISFWRVPQSRPFRHTFDVWDLTYSSSQNRPLLFRLDAEHEFAISVGPHETKLVTFRVPLAGKSLAWPIAQAQECFLSRWREFDSAVELGLHRGLVRTVN